MPLHLSASVVSTTIRSETSIPPQSVALPAESGEQNEIAKASEAESLGLFGPGNRKKKRHKEKKKRMGRQKTIQDKINERGVFGKKKNGVGRNVLFLVVPAVAVVGLALLFASSTKNKNADSLTEPDPNGTN